MAGLPDDQNLDTEGLDIESALTSISEDLFGQESKEGLDGEQPKVEGEPTPAPKEGEAPPQSDEEKAKAEEEAAAAEKAKSEENSQAVQDVGAPKTWTKEEIAEWATMSPGAKAAVLRREEDMFRGLEQYKEKAELGSRYDAVVEPFRAALAAEQVDPVQLFQSFSANHYLLARGTPEQKLEVATHLVKSYGLDIDAIKARLGNEPVVDPKVQELERQIAELRGGVEQQQQAQLELKRAEFSKQVESFASDPKNVYFSEVSADIANLLKTGAATSLQQAYDMAVYNNPSTREKEIARITAERIESEKKAEADRVAKAEKAKAANVNSKQKTVDGTVPVGSLDETLNETMASIKARG
jgi:hypothetical protein